MDDARLAGAVALISGSDSGIGRATAIAMAGAGANVAVTPMNQVASDNPQVRAEKSAIIPLRRPASPEEIAGVAVFLSSTDASYIQGTTVFVDGGLTLAIGQGA